MSEVNLERSAARWALVEPKAIAESSFAAIMFLVSDAKKDIATLADAIAAKDAEIIRLHEELTRQDAEIARLREALRDVRGSAKNARGAVESNQVIDKDVHGTLSSLIAKIDAALKEQADA